MDIGVFSLDSALQMLPRPIRLRHGLFFLSILRYKYICTLVYFPAFSQGDTVAQLHHLFFDSILRYKLNIMI